MSFQGLKTRRVSEADFLRICALEINFIVTQYPAEYPVDSAIVLECVTKVAGKYRLLQLPAIVYNHLYCGIPGKGIAAFWHIYFTPDSFEVAKFQIILGL